MTDAGKVIYLPVRAPAAPDVSEAAFDSLVDLIVENWGNPTELATWIVEAGWRPTGGSAA